MKRLSYAIAMMLVGVVLASCTLTIAPGEEPAQQQTRPEVVTRPSSSVIVITPTHPRNEQIIYRCSGSRLLVRYLDNYDHSEIFYDGKWNQLNRDRTVSGKEVYSNDTYQWHVEGREGYLVKHGDTVIRECKY